MRANIPTLDSQSKVPGGGGLARRQLAKQQAIQQNHGQSLMTTRHGQTLAGTLLGPPGGVFWMVLVEVGSVALRNQRQHDSEAPTGIRQQLLVAMHRSQPPPHLARPPSGPKVLNSKLFRHRRMH